MKNYYYAATTLYRRVFLTAAVEQKPSEWDAMRRGPLLATQEKRFDYLDGNQAQS